jgi:excisionase family DNA binding protein
MDQDNCYMSQFLKASEIAEKLNVSKSLVYKLIKQGDIRCVQIGSSLRVRPEDLEVYIRENLTNHWE